MQKSTSSHLVEVTPKYLVSFHFLGQSLLPQAEGHPAAIKLVFKGCYYFLVLVLCSPAVPSEKGSRQLKKPAVLLGFCELLSSSGPEDKVLLQAAFLHLVPGSLHLLLGAAVL